MFIKFFTSTIMVLFSSLCYSQENRFSDGFYIKLGGAVHLNMTDRSNIINGGGTVGPRSGSGEKTYFSRAQNFCILGGKDFKVLPIFIEAGYGVYILSYKNPLNFTFWGSDFGSIVNHVHYDQFVFAAGYRFRLSQKMNLSPNLGFRFIESRNKQPDQQLAGSVSSSSNAKPDSINYNISISNFRFNTFLFKIGFNLEYTISNKFTIVAEGYWDHGVKSLITTGTTFDYYTFGVHNREYNVTYTKGDNIGLMISLKYLPFQSKS